MKRVLAALCAACLAASVLSATIDLDTDEQAACDAEGGCVFATKEHIRSMLEAAYAAGLAAGYWPDRQVLRGFWRKAGEWRPAMTADRRDAERARWRHAIAVARMWGQRPG